MAHSRSDSSSNLCSALSPSSALLYLQTPQRQLPMMYMEDALQAAITLMEADASQVRVRTSYNVTAFSFSPAQLASCIQHHIPELQVTYNPDKVIFD